jgi:hypothetical protein
MKKHVLKSLPVALMLVLCAFDFVCITQTAHSQCACINGAAVGGLTPVSGSANPGILKSGNIRVGAFYKSGNGDEYYAGTQKTDQGVVKSYLFDYVGLDAALGISDDLTFDIESGYFINKMQDFSAYRLSSNGFSHLSASLKHNLYKGWASEIEYTAGIGARIPLNFKDDNVPQNILPSTGSYGLVIHSFLHKGFKNKGTHLFLINRAEINNENNLNYKYGSAVFSSIIATKSFFDKLTALFEIRNEYRSKDKYLGNSVGDSGGIIFVASPQLSYMLSDFFLSAMFDYPFYKNYNGKQLSNSYSFGLMCTWQTDVF